MLTFLEVGFAANLVQGFRVYAWRAVPSFPQIALCALEMQSDPSPLELRPSLTQADISKDISNFKRPQENNTSSFNYFQLEHLLDSDSEFVALLRLEVRSQCPNWPFLWIAWVAQPNIKQHQDSRGSDCGIFLEVFDVDTSQLWLSGATVRPRQRGRRGIDTSGGPPGGHYLQQMLSPSILFFVFSWSFVVSARIIQTVPNLTKTKRFSTRKAST